MTSSSLKLNNMDLQKPQSSHVPKFGDWDDHNIPYTTFFENARKEHSTGTVRVNPNDPEDNPDAFVFGTEIDRSVPMEDRQIRGHVRENSRGSVASKSGSDQSSADYPRGWTRSRVPMHTRQSSATQPSNESQHRRTASIPKFGAWDEADPRAGEGFTVIFNRVKEEKQVASSTFPTVGSPQTDRNERTGRKKKAKSCSSLVCCCLFWK